jgi:radical SAM enzyme (TIGR01210 family)
MRDTIQTVKDIAQYTNTISLNPTNVQRNTLVEYLWRRHQYRPPWLWSIVEILQQGKKYTKVRLQCDIAGGGNIRGPHNCMTCDQNILHAISEFSLSQKKTIFDDLTCDCKEKWRDQLDCEQLSFGSHIDFSRWKT